jgi:hypothetical protein
MARTSRHDGYATSQHVQPRIELTFAWLKTIYQAARPARVDWLFVIVNAAFNLIRLPKLLWVRPDVDDVSSRPTVPPRITTRSVESDESRTRPRSRSDFSDVLT